MAASLTTEERETLQQRLKQAEDALHRRSIGRAVSRIRHGDKDETFVGTSVSDLKSYISNLRGQLGLPTGRQHAQRAVLG